MAYDLEKLQSGPQMTGLGATRSQQSFLVCRRKPELGDGSRSSGMEAGLTARHSPHLRAGSAWGPVCEDHVR